MDKGTFAALDMIRDYLDHCIVRGNCSGCPFHLEGRDGMTGKCAGTKTYGPLLTGYLDTIEKELKNGKQKNK